MQAKISYRIYKARPIGAEEGAPMCWILIRGGSVSTSIGYCDCLPETDAAVFTSEKEANLFAAHLRSLESAAEKVASLEDMEALARNDPNLRD